MRATISLAFAAGLVISLAAIGIAGQISPAELRLGAGARAVHVPRPVGGAAALGRARPRPAAPRGARVRRRRRGVRAPARPALTRVALTACAPSCACPGSAPSSPFSCIGRLPMGALGLLLILRTHDRTDSFASGGLVAASYTIALGFSNPALARWVDRAGQTLVLRAGAVVSVGRDGRRSRCCPASAGVGADGLRRAWRARPSRPSAPACARCGRCSRPTPTCATPPTRSRASRCEIDLHPRPGRDRRRDRRLVAARRAARLRAGRAGRRPAVLAAPGLARLAAARARRAPPRRRAARARRARAGRRLRALRAGGRRGRGRRARHARAARAARAHRPAARPLGRRLAARGAASWRGPARPSDPPRRLAVLLAAWGAAHAALALAAGPLSLAVPAAARRRRDLARRSSTPTAMLDHLAPAGTLDRGVHLDHDRPDRRHRERAPRWPACSSRAPRPSSAFAALGGGGLLAAVIVRATARGALRPAVAV